MAEAGLLGTSYDKLHRRNQAEKITATANRLKDLFSSSDEDTIEAAVPAIQDVFADIEQITVTADPNATTVPDETGYDRLQSSLGQFGMDNEGTTQPIATAKLSYYAALVVVSWSATLGSLV